MNFYFVCIKFLINVNPRKVRDKGSLSGVDDEKSKQ